MTFDPCLTFHFPLGDLEDFDLENILQIFMKIILKNSNFLHWGGGVEINLIRFGNVSEV